MGRHLTTAVALLAAVMAAASCSRQGPSAEATPAQAVPRAPLTLADLDLDAEAKAWLAERRSGGGALRIAMRERADSYVKQPDGGVKGFDYELVRELCRVLGLRPEISVQKTIDAFFTRDGVMPPDLGTGGDYSYTPDLLERVDLYAGPFGITPWRGKLATWIPAWPTRNMLAGRKGEEIGNLRQLDRKIFAVIKDSIQEKNLRTLATEHGIGLSFVYGASENECFDLVISGKADYVLDASVVMAKNNQRLGALSLSPFPEPVIAVGWAVKMGNRPLASILSAFMRAAQGNGIFAELWTATFLMDFGEYLDAVLASTEAGA